MLFSLIGRIGCAILLILLGAVGFATKQHWIPLVKPHLPLLLQGWL